MNKPAGTVDSEDQMFHMNILINIYPVIKPGHAQGYRCLTSLFLLATLVRHSGAEDTNC